MLDERKEDMKNKALVSILIPAYNHENFVDDIMQSILDQTYDNLEVLITDDCSVDGTYETISQWGERLESKCQRVQIFRNEKNKGIVKTLNDMLQFCVGEYIKVIASDDFFMPDAIEKLVLFLESNPQYGLVFANGIIGDKNTHYPLAGVKSLKTYYTEKPKLEENVVEQMYCKYFLFSPSIMYTRRAYQQVGSYDEDIWFEDWDYYLRIVEQMPIGYLDSIVVIYRMSDSSASHSVKLEYRMGMRKSEIMVLFKHKKVVDAKLSQKLFFSKCNEVFKEAFDMRSRIYVNEIYSLMKGCGVKRNIKNRCLSVVYKLHLIDFLFS